MTPAEPNNPALKLAMSKLLATQIVESKTGVKDLYFWNTDTEYLQVRESEWLYVMHLVEQTMDGAEYDEYEELLRDFNLRGDGDGWTVCSTFNQRATAMCKVKNIEV